MKPHPSLKGNYIHFIQYLFPNGKTDDQWIKCSIETYDKAKELWESGFYLEIENQDGKIWATVINHTEEMVVDRFCSNGTDVPQMIDNLIIEAFNKFIYKNKGIRTNNVGESNEKRMVKS